MERPESFAWGPEATAARHLSRVTRRQQGLEVTRSRSAEGTGEKLQMNQETEAVYAAWSQA